jgi:hypothetical protein
MLTLMTAALVAAQPVPTADTHAQHGPMQHGQMTPAQHEQHEKKDCCKDCCKDMADKHEGHRTERGHSAD